MIDEAQQEQAALYALDLLSVDEAAEFRAALPTNPELRTLVEEFRSCSTALVHTLPLVKPPAGMLPRILAEIHGSAPASVPAERSGTRPYPRWALAASLALAAGLLVFAGMELRHFRAAVRDQLASAAAQNAQADGQIAAMQTEQRQLVGKLEELKLEQQRFGETVASLTTERQRMLAERDALQQEVSVLRNRDALAQVRVATLKAQLETFAQVGAVVIWDNERQSGVLTFDNLPAPAANKDYQLWIIDPRYSAPISAGVMPTTAGTTLRVNFKPALPITAADKFAVSIERKGGAPTAQGPIVLLSK